MPKTLPNRQEEYKLKRRGFKLVAGVDEAGRGPWAGPIVAAAAVLRPRQRLNGVNDSKKLTARQREKIFSELKEKLLLYNICIIDNQQIDSLGIGPANLLALQRAAQGLARRADAVLVDGFAIDLPGVYCQKVIKGDSRVLSIAAASILAKVTRDILMDEMDKQFPNYGFARHKGYGTSQHRLRLEKYGICPIHRRTYRPIRDML